MSDEAYAAVVKYLERNPGSTIDEVARQLLLGRAEVAGLFTDMRHAGVAGQRQGKWRIVRPAYLVEEKGLRNNRRNRQWLELTRVLSTCGLTQEHVEEVSWAALRAVEETR